jgi:hypothetical protein
MNGTVIFGIIALFFILSSLTNFISDLQDEVDQSSTYNSKNRQLRDESYYSENVVGEKTILLNGLRESKKRELWSNSSLKKEMMDFFPDFSLMHEFVEERMIDDSSFKKKLLEKIDTTEEQYISGVLSGQRAKATLSTY